ncbi:hypothetical protein [Herbidospora mongoliensis]|uniref:hypothetical protein n=1 Tax=Herbidospora mongoliensis TaxID=688067 RepID=UPI0008360EBE|nr:hypothetical protein [Herbidospora mongoliensis]
MSMETVDRPPDSAHELRMALRKPTTRWSDPATLGLDEAAAELMAWLNDRRTFDALHTAAFESVLRDFEWATQNGVCSEVATSLHAELRDVDVALRPLRRNWSGDREAAKTAARSLIRRLGQHDVLQAAWRDLWTKVSGRQSSPDVIAVSRDLFLDIARRNGHNIDWGSQFLSRLSAVLADDAWGVAVLNTLLDPSASSAEVEAEEPERRAGLTPAQRNVLCERFLALPPDSSWHAVWLVYEKASMPVLFASLGEISFFASEAVPKDTDAASAKCSSYGQGWSDRDGECVADMPHKRGVVLVRVFLSPGIYADPVAVARGRVDGLVAMGRFRTGLGVDYWRLATGYADISESYTAEEHIDFDASAISHPLDHPRQSAIFTEMRAFWQEIGSAPSFDDERLAESLDLLHWWQAAGDQSSLAQVIANVRVIESAATRVGDTKWKDHLSAYIKPAWIVRSVHQDLIDTVTYAIGCSRGGLTQEACEKRRVIARAVLDKSRLGWIRVRPGSTRKALAELTDLYPDRHHVRRRLRTLNKRLTSPHAFQTWRSQLEFQWICLADRLARIRDSITHGGPVTADGVDSVLSFSSLTSAWELRLSLESALKGTHLKTAHADFRDEHDVLLDKMSSASCPGDVIHESALPSP